MSNELLFLKELLFERCLAEHENYKSKLKVDLLNIDDTLTIRLNWVERNEAWERYLAIYQIIAKAQLEDEYEEWKCTR